MKMMALLILVLAFPCTASPHRNHNHKQQGQGFKHMNEAERWKITTLTDSLVAYYGFEEDFSQHLYAQNSVPPNRNPLWPTWISSEYLFPRSSAGKIGQGADFDYTNDTFILLASESAPEFLFDGDRTVCFWVKFRSFNDVNALFWKSLPFGSAEYNVRVTDITHRIIVNETITHSQELLIDTWYFIAITFQRSTHTWRIIVYPGDGIATTGVDTVTDTADLFGIGGNPTIDGIIDEFGIWQRILNSKEIAALYNGGDGMSYEDIVDASTPGRCRSIAQTCECRD